MVRKIKAIIVDDSPADAELIAFSINEHFEADLRMVDNLQEFENTLLDFRPELIISDYDLRKFSGVDALALTRQHFETIPFILVTGAISDKNAIEALRLGATDYVLKNNLRKLPFVVERVMTEFDESNHRKKVEKQREELLLQVTSKKEKLQALFNLSSNVPQGTNLTLSEINRIGQFILSGFDNPDQLVIRILSDNVECTVGDSENIRPNGIIEEFYGSHFNISVQVCWQKTAKRDSFSEEETSFLKSAVELISAKVELQRSQDKLIGIILETEEKERRRIASEIHDNLQQMLVVVNQNLNILSKRVTAEKNVTKPLEISKEYVMSAIKESRRIAHNLAPQYAGNLVTMIQEHLKSLENMPDLSFDFESEITQPHKNQNIDIQLFRIVQECINNIIKHSGAKNVKISITSAFDMLSLAIVDNGKGFKRNEVLKGGANYGINSIVSRASSIGGTVSIDSRPGIGTFINVKVPIG